MKIISNDLRSSCRMLLLDNDGGGSGAYRDDIFHDILKNSEKVIDVPLPNNYRLTINVWATSRQDVYETHMNKVNAASYRAIGDGDCQNLYYCNGIVVHLVIIAWCGDTPLYAQLTGHCSSFSDGYTVIVKPESNDTGIPAEYFGYRMYKYEYIKGSAAVGDSNAKIDFPFRNWIYDVLYYSDMIFIPTNVTFRYKRTNYGTEYDKVDWTNPDTGETSQINDQTKYPRIIEGSSSESVETLFSGGETELFYLRYYGIFSDFSTNEELINAHHGVVKAICLLKGTDYVPPVILHPESEV